jgi:hypothetical protein
MYHELSPSHPRSADPHKFARDGVASEQASDKVNSVTVWIVDDLEGRVRVHADEAIDHDLQGCFFA